MHSLPTIIIVIVVTHKMKWCQFSTYHYSRISYRVLLKMLPTRADDDLNYVDENYLHLTLPSFLPAKMIVPDNPLSFPSLRPLCCWKISSRQKKRSFLKSRNGLNSRKRLSLRFFFLLIFLLQLSYQVLFRKLQNWLLSLKQTAVQWTAL